MIDSQERGVFETLVEIKRLSEEVGEEIKLTET